MDVQIKLAKQRVRRVVTRAAGPTVWNILNNNALLIFRVLSVLIYYIVGATYYHAQEGWTVIDSVYFVTVSVATIGYGYLYPTSDASRVFTAFFIIAGLIFVLTAADDFALHVVIRFQNYLIGYFYPRITDLDRAAKKLSMTFACLVGLSFLCMIFFISNEQWSGAAAFYWTVATMTTVGYGDLNVKHDSTRIFSIFFIAFCVIGYATVIHNVQEVYSAALQPSQQQHLIEVPTLASRFRERRPQFDSGIDADTMGVTNTNPMLAAKYRRAHSSSQGSSNVDDLDDDNADDEDDIVAGALYEVTAIDDEEEEVKIDLEAAGGSRNSSSGMGGGLIIETSAADANVVQWAYAADSLNQKQQQQQTRAAVAHAATAASLSTPNRPLRRYYSLQGSKMDVFSPIRSPIKSPISPPPAATAIAAVAAVSSAQREKKQQFSKSFTSPPRVSPQAGNSSENHHLLTLIHSYNASVAATATTNSGNTSSSTGGNGSTSSGSKGRDYDSNISSGCSRDVDCTLFLLQMLQQLHTNAGLLTALSKAQQQYELHVHVAERISLPIEVLLSLLRSASISHRLKPLTDQTTTAVVATVASEAENTADQDLGLQDSLSQADHPSSSSGSGSSCGINLSTAAEDVISLATSIDVAEHLHPSCSPIQQQQHQQQQQLFATAAADSTTAAREASFSRVHLLPINLVTITGSNPAISDDLEFTMQDVNLS